MPVSEEFQLKDIFQNNLNKKRLLCKLKKLRRLTSTIYYTDLKIVQKTCMSLIPDKNACNIF